MAGERFEPKWPDERNEGRMFVPEPDSRTEYPWEAPKEVFDIVETTYGGEPLLGSNTRKRFKLFPKLPLELRRLIWKRSLPGKRVVEVFYDDRTGTCVSPCPIPTALHVSSEAREVALEHYQLSFATGRVQAKVYFDFKVDALFIGLGNFSPTRIDPCRLFFTRLHSGDHVRLTHLIIDDRLNPFFKEIDVDLSIPDSNDEDDDAEESATAIGEDYETVVEANRGERYSLESLKSLTLINEHGDYDMVLQETEENPGEFHAWDISNVGRAVPYDIPQSADMEDFYFSELWRSVERGKWKGLTNVTTVRYVSRARLYQDPTWSQRVRFLDQTVQGSFSYCLYRRDGVMDRILELEQDHPDDYEALRDMFDDNDPEFIYICQNPCVCPIGHRSRVLSDPEMQVFDLRVGLDIIKSLDEEINDGVPVHHVHNSSSADTTATEPGGQTSELEDLPAWPAYEHNEVLASPQSSPPIHQDGFRSFDIEAASRLPYDWLTDPTFPPIYVARRRAHSSSAAVTPTLFTSFGGFATPPMPDIPVQEMFPPQPSPSTQSRTVTRASSLIDELEVPNMPDFPVLPSSPASETGSAPVEQLRDSAPKNKSARSGQNARLNQANANTSALATLRQLVHKVFYVCMAIGIWPLLALILAALLYSVLKLLVAFLTVVILLIFGLWGLCIVMGFPEEVL